MSFIHDILNMSPRDVSLKAFKTNQERRALEQKLIEAENKVIDAAFRWYDFPSACEDEGVGALSSACRELRRLRTALPTDTPPSRPEPA